MLSRRFMHVCIGLLALAIAFEMGAHTAGAQSPGFRLLSEGIVVIGESVYGLHTSSPPYGWRLFPDGEFDLPPVAPSTLISYSSGQIAITESGEGWGKVGGVWTNLGPIPGTPTVKTSWGQVKTKYIR